MSFHLKLGEEGERIAEAYLVNLGYIIYHRNWRMGSLEVDLIVEEGNELVFVEVKTRSSDKYGMPELAIDYKKEQNLITAADVYLREVKTDIEVRFDVISILLNENTVKVNHIIDCFSSEVWMPENYAD